MEREDVLSLILDAETEYRSAVRTSVKEAENYAAECRAQQTAHYEALELDWLHFENAETEKLEKALSAVERKEARKAIKAKGNLRAKYENKAEAISGRLFEEVLSIWR